MPYTRAEIEQIIDDNLPSNGKRDIKAVHFRNVLVMLLDYMDQNTIEKKNIAVLSLLDGDLITHNMNSDKLDVRFYAANEENRTLTWEPVGLNNIRVYLPELDGVGVNTFIGDVFIIKRS